MTINKIIYEQLFPNPYVQFGNIRMSIEIILQEGDSIADAYTKGHQEANENFNRLFPQVVQAEQTDFYDAPRIVPTNDEYGQFAKLEPKKSRVEVLIQDIERCKSLEGANGLLSWRLLVSKNPELQPAFDKKLKELSK